MRSDAPGTPALHRRLETAEQQTSAREELQRILASPSFRGSQRCRHFLQFVVQESIEGRFESLRERTLGVEIFGRPPDYDTSIDAIVRVKANEVRRRLAQAYVELGAPLGVRIDLPPGSYVAGFVWLPMPEPAAPPEPRPASHRLLIAGVAALVLALCALAVWKLLPARTPADRFWAPVVNSPKPVLICSGSPVVYHLSRRVHDRYKESHPGLPPGPYAVQLPPDEPLTGRDVVAAVDQYLGVGDALASGHLTALFARAGKPFQRRIGSDVSFTDLRDYPTVLIGAFSNRWTLQMTGSLRMVFDTGGNGVRMVRERVAPFRAWALPNLQPGGRTTEDYALVSRAFDAESGQLLVSAAGITQYGTQAAGEFLTDFAALSQALRQAPDGWETKNLQMVLHIQVIGKTPSRPRVLAAHFW